MSTPAPPWFAPLLDPVRDRVAAAWARLPHPDAAADVPRAGLGGAVVAHVARGWGTRRWQEIGRVGITLVEGWNQHVHRGAPDDTTRTAWITADLGRAGGVVRDAARRDEALLRRVAVRLLATPDLGAERVPEAVIFLRGAVAAGVVAGKVPDGAHAGLDRWAAALGRALEAGGDAEAHAAAIVAAREALAGLPDCDARERFASVLDGVPAHPAAPRGLDAWVPCPVPALDAPPADPLEALLRAPFTDAGPLPDAARWLAARGGKRLRARIALAAARAVGGPDAAAVPVALAAEWAHTASLVLDDIIDEADLRRGAPALHRVTSTPFAVGVAGWVLARTLLAAPEGASDVADTLLALAEGQRAELARAGDLTMSLDDWYTIAAAKTSRLFAYAASGGGAAGGATRRQQKALARYGQELGLAFQIVDDLLDYVGDTAVLGKRAGQDQRTGRVTYPLLLLREDEPDALGAPPDALLAALHRHDVPNRCLARARAHHDHALAALVGLPGDVTELHTLATRCVERQA